MPNSPPIQACLRGRQLPDADRRTDEGRTAEGRTDDRSRPWIIVTFLFLLTWQLALVWIYPHFATQDGPSHLYNAALLRHFHDPAWPRVPEFYKRNSRLVPNWFTYAVLACLYSCFSPATAEKILVTAYFVLFPLSFIYLLRTLTKTSAKDAWLFAIWSLVFANNLFIAMGFYNFCYSLIFFLLCFGYWMRSPNRFGPKQLVTLCALASLLYFSHIVGFFMAAFFIGVASTCRLLTNRRSKSENSEARPPNTISRQIKRLLIPQLAFLPCLIIFLSSSTGSQPAYDPGPRTLLQRLLVFRDLHVLTDTRGPNALLRICLIGGFLLWASYAAIKKAIKPRQLLAGEGPSDRPSEAPGERSDGALGIAAAVCLSLAMVLPWSISGGGMLPERMAWFGLCAALLWLSSKQWSAKARLATVTISTLVVLFGLISQTGWRYQMSKMLSAYDEAGPILLAQKVPQKTILSLCYCNPADNPSRVFANLRIRPLEHAGDIAALEGRAISLDNYEAMGSAFPIEYSPKVNPALYEPTLAASTVASRPETADIANYESRTGKTVDYVLLWGTREDTADRGSILGQRLQSNYELIYISSPPALLHLFKRKQTIN
jgi:hypothetical protein